MSTEGVIDTVLVNMVRDYDLNAALGAALEQMVLEFKVNVGRIWLIQGPKFVVTHQIPASEVDLIGQELSPTESAMIVLSFTANSELAASISRSIFVVNESNHEWSSLKKLQAYPHSLYVLLNAGSALVGLLSLQCEQERIWTSDELLCIQRITQLFSVLVRLARDVTDTGTVS